MSRPFQARPEVAVAREAVVLAFEAHEEYFAAQVFEGGEQLLGLFYAATQVAFAVND